MYVNPLRSALVLGLFLAGWHLCWAILVFLGFAQSLLDFVFWMHFITPPYHVEAFEVSRAGILIGFTGVIGWLAGLAIGYIWNLFHPAPMHH